MCLRGNNPVPHTGPTDSVNGPAWKDKKPRATMRSGAVTLPRPSLRYGEYNRAGTAQRFAPQPAAVDELDDYADAVEGGIRMSYFVRNGVLRQQKRSGFLLTL